jgi:hypothetical protein
MSKPKKIFKRNTERQVGGDQFVDPPKGYKGANRWTNWHGFRAEFGSGYGTSLLDELQEKRDNIEACIVVVTGGGGKGKTYFTLRLAEILDPKFDVDVQVPFGPDEFMELISPDSPLGIGRVIVVDESQFAISSRDWYADIQKDLMKQLEAIRSKGFIIFIVALSEATLDVIARSYVITHKIHLMKRGRARVYTYQMGPFSKAPYPKTISRDEKMCLPGAEYCEHSSCLKCPYSGVAQPQWKHRNRWEEENMPLCQTIRARYERKKKFFLTEMAEIANEKRKEAQMKKTQLSDIVAILREHVAMLRKTKRNRIDLSSATAIIRQFLGSGIPDNFVKKACRELDVDDETMGRVQMLNYSVKPIEK